MGHITPDPMPTPKELCDIGVCVSQAQARRMIDGMEKTPDASKVKTLRMLIEARRENHLLKAKIARLRAALYEIRGSEDIHWISMVAEETLNNESEAE